MVREGQRVKSRMGGAKPERWAIARPQVSDEEEKTIAHAPMGANSSTLSASLSVQYNH